ncbi:RCC1 domain-containing protein [Myxococcota bacterium]
MVSVGSHHSCGIINDGSIWCWGANRFPGILGLGDPEILDLCGDYDTQCSYRPRRVTGITAAVNLSVGPFHTCTILGDDSIWCWGLNTSGQLGNGTLDSTSVPTSVTSMDDAIEVSVGGSHSCAIRSDGSLWCWGENSAGQLGIGAGPEFCTSDATAFACSKVPVEIPLPSAAVSISSSTFHSCAVTVGGDTYCWGSDYANQLGVVNLQDCPGGAGICWLPELITGISDAVEVYTSLWHTCIRAYNGSVWCWGHLDFSGADVANGLDSCDQRYNTDNCTSIPGIVLPGEATRISSRASLWPHTCALVVSETVCWGANYAGQLGDGTTTYQQYPVPVAGPSGFISISAGDVNTCGVSADGSAWCWGSNTYGRLGTDDKDGPGQCNSSLYQGPCSTIPVRVANPYNE